MSRISIKCRGRRDGDSRAGARIACALLALAGFGAAGQAQAQSFASLCNGLGVRLPNLAATGTVGSVLVRPSSVGTTKYHGAWAQCVAHCTLAHTRATPTRRRRRAGAPPARHVSARAQNRTHCERA